MIRARTVDQLLKQAQFRDSFRVLPRGNTFKNLSTIIVMPTRGRTEEKKSLNCKKCRTKNEYVATTFHGFDPLFVEAYKRLVRPMNVPIIELVIAGHEVGEAYSQAVERILATPMLRDFKYLLTVEDDNLIPFIPNTQGPLMMLYEDIERGFDVAGGLYWTKGNPSMPLVYGDPKAKLDDAEGYFKVRHDWKPGQIVECNGMGMGFTLFKLDIFKDARLKKPWFKTCSEHGENGVKLYTQDLYFFEQIRKLGYLVCVDTRVKVGHLDIKTGVIY